MFGANPTNIRCSRAGCNADATVSLIWRNPKIHTDGRTKNWLACDEHLEFLVDYLDTRGFLISTESIS